MAGPEPPHVLFAVGSLNTGGSETQLVQLVPRLHPHRLRATLVLKEVGVAERVAEMEALGVRVVVVGRMPGRRPVRALRTAIGYLRVIRAVRPDAVYAWLEESSLLLAPLGRLHGVGVAVARRNISGATVERWRPAAMAIRRAERLAHVVTANSQAVLDRAIERGIASERLRLVRNGHAPPAAPPIPAAPPVTIGYLARFRSEKGHRRLVAALSELNTAVPWRVLLGGDGELRAEIEAAVDRAGLGAQVKFLGDVRDTEAFWARTHICALLSDHEGSPNALIEGALAGRPLLSTRVGGSPEIVGADGGLLVDPEDPAMIVAALRDLIEHDDLRARLGEAARLRALELFDLDRSAEAHLAAVMEAVNGRRL